MNAPTLYHLSGNFAALDELFDLIDGMHEDDPGYLSVVDWMAELQASLEQKAEQCIRYIQQQEAMSEARKAEADRLLKLSMTNDSRAERVKLAIGQLLEARGLRKVECKLGVIGWHTNGGKAPLEVRSDVVLPDRFIRVKREPDRDAIRTALEAGDPEACAIATLRPRGQSIRIK